MTLRPFAKGNFDNLHENEQFEELLNILEDEYGGDKKSYCYLIM